MKNVPANDHRRVDIKCRNADQSHLPRALLFARLFSNPKTQHERIHDAGDCDCNTIDELLRNYSMRNDNSTMEIRWPFEL